MVTVKRFALEDISRGRVFFCFSMSDLDLLIDSLNPIQLHTNGERQKRLIVLKQELIKIRNETFTSDRKTSRD